MNGHLQEYIEGQARDVVASMRRLMQDEQQEGYVRKEAGEVVLGTLNFLTEIDETRRAVEHERAERAERKRRKEQRRSRDKTTPDGTRGDEDVNQTEP